MQSLKKIHAWAQMKVPLLQKMGTYLTYRWRYIKRPHENCLQTLGDMYFGNKLYLLNIVIFRSGQFSFFVYYISLAATSFKFKIKLPCFTVILV